MDGSLANADGVLPDTYMNVAKSSWAKGVAFINGYNLVSAQLSNFGILRVMCQGHCLNM